MFGTTPDGQLSHEFTRSQPVSLPTYFIARSDKESTPHRLLDVAESVHAVDVFRTCEADRFIDWIITVDGRGGLHALRYENRETFPEALQSELAYQELISGQPRRTLQLSEFYLIGARYLDQPAQAPGPNDPVHLYGTLYGPYKGVQDSEIQAIEGQLTLTRADVLDAIINGAPHAFRYPSPSGEDRNAPRCLHMMLPADREDAIVEGRGIAFGYLLMPSDLMLSDAANEVLTSQTIYELLSALKHDLRKESIQHPLCTATLPVPSRPMLERQLETEGYKIQGNEAIKQATSSSGFTGFLAAVFGTNEKRLTLPPEGRLEDFLRLAHVTLAALAGWPTPRVAALRQRSDASKLSPQRPVPKPASVPPSVRVEPPGPAPAASPDPPQKQPQIWKKPESKKTKPEWMKDFQQTDSEPAKRPEKPAKPKGPKRPDWMKDFE